MRSKVSFITDDAEIQRINELYWWTPLKKSMILINVQWHKDASFFFCFFFFFFVVVLPRHILLSLNCGYLSCLSNDSFFFLSETSLQWRYVNICLYIFLALGSWVSLKYSQASVVRPLSFVNIFKRHLLWSHEADSCHISHIAPIGRGERIILFLSQLDKNSGCHGNLKFPLTFNGKKWKLIAVFAVFLQIFRIFYRNVFWVVLYDSY